MNVLYGYPGRGTTLGTTEVRPDEIISLIVNFVNLSIVVPQMPPTKQFSKCNFFIWTSYALRISGFVYSYLIRSFPVSFHSRESQKVDPYVFSNMFQNNQARKIYTGVHIHPQRLEMKTRQKLPGNE